MPDPTRPDARTILPNIQPLDVTHLRTLRDIKSVLPASHIQAYGEAKANYLRQGADGVGLANDLTEGMLGHAINTPDAFKLRDCVAEFLAEHLIGQEDFLDAWKKNIAGQSLQSLNGGTVVNNLDVSADFSSQSQTKSPIDINAQTLAALADVGFNISTIKQYHSSYDRLGTKYWLIGRLLTDAQLPEEERSRRNSLYVRTLRVAAANGLVDEKVIGEAAVIVHGLVDRMAFNLGDHNFNPAFSDNVKNWTEALQKTTIPLLTTPQPDEFFTKDPIAAQARGLLTQRIQGRQPLRPSY